MWIIKHTWFLNVKHPIVIKHIMFWTNIAQTMNICIKTTMYVLFPFVISHQAAVLQRHQTIQLEPVINIFDYVVQLRIDKRDNFCVDEAVLCRVVAVYLITIYIVYYLIIVSFHIDFTQMQKNILCKYRVYIKLTDNALH